MSCCLVAIAKNEARFLPEWLAHYLALGIDHVFLFDNESTDQTAPLMEALAGRFPVTRIPWPTPLDRSPQIAAYAHAVRRLVQPYEWAAFFDCDEFLVLKADRTIASFLKRYGKDVGALAISWLTFGSAGRAAGDYRLVTEAFRLGGSRAWGNNRHFKTIARTAALRRVGVHVAEFDRGRYIHPNGEPVAMPRRQGHARRIDHSLAQLNHYQLKSRQDFAEKVSRGRAGKKPTDPARFRLDPEKFFAAMDRNNFEYDDIDNLRDARLAMLEQIEAVLGSLRAA